MCTGNNDNQGGNPHGNNNANTSQGTTGFSAETFGKFSPETAAKFQGQGFNQATGDNSATINAQANATYDAGSQIAAQNQRENQARQQAWADSGGYLHGGPGSPNDPNWGNYSIGHQLSHMATALAGTTSDLASGIYGAYSNTVGSPMAVLSNLLVGPKPNYPHWSDNFFEPGGMFPGVVDQEKDDHSTRPNETFNAGDNQQVPDAVNTMPVVPVEEVEPMFLGGLIEKGKAYLTGEQGPELIVTGENGKGEIVPNEATVQNGKVIPRNPNSLQGHQGVYNWENQPTQVVNAPVDNSWASNWISKYKNNTGVADQEKKDFTSASNKKSTIGSLLEEKYRTGREAVSSMFPSNEIMRDVTMNPWAKHVWDNNSALGFNFIQTVEGTENQGYVPQNSYGKVLGNSGVTVATGFDLGQRKNADLAGLPPELIKKLQPYLGVKGKDALKLNYSDLNLTDEEVNIINEFAYNENITRVDRLLKRDSDFEFDNLPLEAQTVIASVAFQYGDLSKKTPKFWGHVTNGDWNGAIAELENFGDSYGDRRQLEANLLRRIRPEEYKIAALDHVAKKYGFG